MSNLFIPIKTADLAGYKDLPYDPICSFSSCGLNKIRHVFIEGNHLISRWQALSSDEVISFTIAETGFGSGLNFLLTWYLWEQYAPKTSRLQFISCEKNPLSLKNLKKVLHLWPELKMQAEQLLGAYPILTPGYHPLSFSEGRVNLTLMLGDALECYEQLIICGESQLERALHRSYVDAWFLDGFVFDKNAIICSESLIKVIALLSGEGTSLTSYSFKPFVVGHLKQHGFSVEKKESFESKKQMIYACFNGIASPNLKKRHTPWHMSRPEQYRNKSAVIVGAGLAGCFTAYSLVKKGWKVRLIDENNKVGCGASGNQQAVLFPKLSAYNSPLAQLMLASFLYASRVYQSILKQSPIGELNGSLLLAYNEKEKLAQAGLHDWLDYYPELGALVNKAQASDLAGLAIDQTGLYIPLSGWIDSPALCEFLVNNEAITLVTDTPVEKLVYDKKWIINDCDTEVLILANGYKISSFEQTKYIPVKPMRGQMTLISASAGSSSLQVPVCAEAHVLPAINGLHLLGATYELNVEGSEMKNQDDLINLSKLRKLAPDIQWSDMIMGHWAGVRASSTDYLPIVGSVVDESAFINLYAGLKSDSKRWIAKASPSYPGLYVCTGFGSRGLTTIPLCAQWLASLINNEMSCLPRSLQQALSPSRFLRKQIINK